MSALQLFLRVAVLGGRGLPGGLNKTVSTENLEIWDKELCGCATYWQRTFNNNIRLFMVPHLVRAQSAYKDIGIYSFHHTHTHTLQIHALLVMDWYRSVCQGEEMGFQFWLKRREWRWMPDRERKGVPDHRSNVLKGSPPQGPSAHPRNTEDVSIHGWEKRVRRRVVSVINKQSSWEKLTTVIVGC